MMFLTLRLAGLVSLPTAVSLQATCRASPGPWESRAPWEGPGSWEWEARAPSSLLPHR